MPPTCADWLTFVRPWLSEALVAEQVFHRLQGAARHLPGDGLAALEIRLAPGAEAVDLSLKLTQPSLPSAVSVWLEFDLERAPDGGLPEPVRCAEVGPDADPLWIVDTLLPEIRRGAPLEARQRDLALRCLGEIPAPARLLYVFDLSPRGTPAIRLEILGLSSDAADAFLRRVAPVLAPPVAALAPLLAEAERPHLSFDIGPEGIAPRAGLEASYVKWPHREPRWRGLFDRLVGEGLCDPGKRDAVLAWPGQESFRAAPGRWPADAAPRGVCVRALSHVKLVARPDDRAEAKVYLLFGWIPDRGSVLRGGS